MSSIWPLLRGRVYLAKLSHLSDEKPFVVVSNNRRNRYLGSALAVRITSSPKPEIPSIYLLPAGEILAGRVIADDIVELFPDEIRRDHGALSSEAMFGVSLSLKAALDLP